MDKQNFIKTSDAATAQMLISEGFVLLSQDGSIYTFLNNGTMNFSKNKKIIYTNILNV